MRKFIYRNNNENGKVIFECQEKSILDADILFEKANGINPVKAPYIGCEIKKDEVDHEQSE